MFVSVAISAVISPQVGVDLPASMSVPGYLLFAIVMGMIFAPKIASFLDVLLTPSLRKQFGGAGPVVFSAISETAFSMMLAPIMAIANTIFLFRLFVLRQSRGWVAQSRSTQALSAVVVFKHLWPQKKSQTY